MGGFFELRKIPQPACYIHTFIGEKKSKKKKKSVTVSWKKAANAKGYRIALSKKKNGKYKKVTDTKKTKYTFKKTKGTYYVKLTAYVVKSDKATFSKATKPVKFKVK